jgi:uncharacterized protein DUF4242
MEVSDVSKRTINPRLESTSQRAVTLYLVERHLPGVTLTVLETLLQAGSRACEASSATNTPVRYLRTTFAPGESRCLCLFEASNADVVQEVNDVAQIPYSRIIPVVDLPMQ